MRKFYRDLADKVDHDFLGSDFYGRIAGDADVPSDDVQKYILANSDFTKGIQTDINHYLTKGRINNASFRQKLDPIRPTWAFVFKNILTIDTKNPIVGSLLKELYVGKKRFRHYPSK